MSWLFSRALVEDFLLGTCLDGQLSVQLSATPTPQAFLSLDRMTGRAQLSRYGMTFAHLTPDRGEAVLTWFLAASPARPTAARLEDGLWRTISGRKCDGSWQMQLPGSYLPRMSSARRSTTRPTTWTRWVTAPAAFPLPRATWVLTTYGAGTGYLHTPTTTANYCCPSMQKWPNCREYKRVFGQPGPENHEWLMDWPIGWTDLRPLATDRYQSWLRKHGGC